MRRAEYPHYQEIDTPWEPQPIVWRFVNSDGGAMRRPSESMPYAGSMLEKAIHETHLSHVVREVRVMRDRLFSFSWPVATVEEELRVADEQFAQLESLTHLKVAPTAWHVFQDSYRNTRTLARVEIIENAKRGPRRLTTQKAVDTFDKAVNTYYAEGRGRLLCDVYDLRQYVLGRPRSNPLSEQALYMVDIEPILMGVANNPRR